MRREYPKDESEEVYHALDAFTDVELEQLVACFDEGTHEFVGIGFMGPGNTFTQFADPAKAEAIRVLEGKYIDELATLTML